MPSALTIPVRWRDLDPLGHVNNCVFLSYLEEGRNHWIEQVLDGSLGADEYVVARVEIDFRDEIVPAATVVASCSVESIGRTSLTTWEELRSPEGDLLAEAKVALVFWNPEQREARPITDAERARFAETRRDDSIAQ